MLKTFLDYIVTNWSVISHAPGAFVITLATSIGLALFIINWHYKQRIESLQARIESLQERLKNRDEDILEIKSKAEQLQKKIEENKNLKNTVSEQDKYATQICHYSNIDLGREAQKVSKNFREFTNRIKEKQGIEYGRVRNPPLNTSLYNVWLRERLKILAIKCEVIKRLPSNVAERLDQIPESCYYDYLQAQDPDQILEIVNELYELGLEIGKFPSADSK